jgi:hypothetical protein
MMLVATCRTSRLLPWSGACELPGKHGGSLKVGITGHGHYLEARAAFRGYLSCLPPEGRELGVDLAVVELYAGRQHVTLTRHAGRRGAANGGTWGGSAVADCLLALHQ